MMWLGNPLDRSACVWGLLVFVLILPLDATAQQQRAAFVGSVRDAETNAPLPYAHVFIAGSTIGTATDVEGRFRLDNVPLGAHRLYVSMLGYEPVTLDTLVRRPTTDTLTLRLEPTVLPAGEVTVTAERDEKWYERLQKFERLFIGTSERADACSLRNPEVLSFETKWWGRFSAEARAPLEIDNYALGYRVRYHLEAFNASGGTVRWDGEPFFEPLTPRDSAETARWAANREAAYRGSMRHFLRALLADRVREEGFIIYRHPREPFRPSSSRFRARASRLIDEAADSTLYELNFFGRLEVIYRHEEESERFLRWQRDVRSDPPGPQTSYLELNEHPVTIDPSGEIVEPYGATAYGYFAFERLADAVPSGYRPARGALDPPR